MKKINLFLLLLLMVCCKPKVEVVDKTDHYEQIINELNIKLVVAEDSIATLNNIISIKEEAYNATLNNLAACDSSNSTLRAELFIVNYKLGRIKEYTEIVRKNPSQITFLRGWINRVLED